MAKQRKTRTVYYARKLLSLQRDGQFIRYAQPGELIDVDALGLSRGEIRMLVEDVRALRAAEIEEDEVPAVDPVLSFPADAPEESDE